jgi:orotate phosphoribosyltransferase-like protein
MGAHLVLDVIALADKGLTREQIAEELNIPVRSVTQRLAYAKRTGQVFTMPPRKRRVAKS